MSLPLVTRFGADPLLDLEIANKRYVDNSLPSAASMIMNGYGQGASATVTYYWPVGYFTTSTVETNRQIPMSFDTTLSHFKIRSVSNNRVGDIAFNVKIDGVNTGITLTVPSSTTGLFTDDVNTFATVNDELLGYEYDPLSSTSGIFTLTSSALRMS